MRGVVKREGDETIDERGGREGRGEMVNAREKERG